MNLFQLRAFGAVAREGSFARATERLYISQPTMTGHVRALEKRYQVTLFRHTTRRIELAEKGSRLVAITRAPFTLEEETEALLGANRQLVSSRLEVTTDGPHLVMPMLARLRTSYPGVTVSLRLGSARETPTALLSEHVDVAMLTEVEARPGLLLEGLVNSHTCTLLPRQRPWYERSKGVLLEKLNQQVMVLREPDSIARRAFGHAYASQGVQPRVLLELDSREVVTKAVAAELGVDVVSSLEVGSDPRIRTVPLVGPELANCRLIGCLGKHRGLRAIRAFLELAAA